MDKLEEKLINALVKAELAEKVADRALQLAQDAIIKVEALKQSTHKVQYVDPYKELFDTAKEEMPEVKEEVKVQKLSPFTVGKAISKVPEKQKEEERDEVWDISMGE